MKTQSTKLQKPSYGTNMHMIQAITKFIIEKRPKLSVTDL